MGSIIGKVVQQITSKTGGYPWEVQANGNIYDVPFIFKNSSTGGFPFFKD